MVARKLSEIAAQLGLILQGDDAEVIGVNTLEGAGPDEVSFLANPKYADQLAATRAGAVIVRPEHAGDVRRALISENPYQDFGRVLELFAAPQGSFSGISPLAFIHPDAELGDGVTVYPFVYIGPHASVGSGVKLFPGVYVGENVRIGKGTTVYPNAVLMAGTHVGEGCILHPGSVLGADGFGFARTPAGIQKIPQVGKVTIGNAVEVGANAAIDRAVLDATRIGDGTKIDNLAQIGLRRLTSGHFRFHHGRGQLHVRRTGRYRRAPAHRRQRHHWPPVGGRQRYPQRRRRGRHAHRGSAYLHAHAGPYAPLPRTLQAPVQA